MEFNFNTKKAPVFHLLSWENYSFFKYANILRRIFSYLFIILFSLFLFGFFTDYFSTDIYAKFFGLSLISLSFGTGFWLLNIFFQLKIKHPPVRDVLPEVKKNIFDFNLAEFMSFESARAVLASIRFSKSKKMSQISSTALFYFLLRDNKKLNFVFNRANISFKNLKKELKVYLKDLEGENFEDAYSSDFQNTIFDSLDIAIKRNNTRIEVEDLLASLSFNDNFLKKILVRFDLKAEDIENLTWWIFSLEERIKKSKRFWLIENLRKNGSIGKDWAAGYSIILDQYSIDWTEIIQRRGFEEVVGHKKSLSQTERILARSQINNVLLVGEPGTGRKSIVHALTQKVLNGQSLQSLNYKRVVELDLTSLLSEITSIEEVESILDKIFKEVVSTGNIILVIDDFQKYVSPIPRPGTLDISGTLSRYLHFPSFQIVAISSFMGLHKYIEQNPSLLSLFERVEVSEISEEDTLLILENLIPFFENKYKIFITYPALRDIISHAKRYLPAIPFPKKAIDLLDEVMVYVARYTKSKIVLPEHVAKIITEKTEIPVGDIETKEREVLLNLEELIHQRIINQDKAVSEVSTALRRSRAEITIRKGPIGAFLFLGPTGVGKTETSKALAEIYFGSEARMIRLDMSEFQATDDIPRLIGSAGKEGLLTTPIRENPFSLLLLDELEKAHANILNLFLQVLDEGSITDGLGRKVSFQNSMIIATSNAGYKIILEALREGTEWSLVRHKLLDFIFSKAIFRPEFINRFDAAVVFRPLTRENLSDIAEILLKQLKKNLKEKDMEFVITETLKDKIAELGYNPVFGAREMRRVIQDRIGNPLAEAILREDLKKGDRVKIDPESFRPMINS